MRDNTFRKSLNNAIYRENSPEIMVRFRPMESGTFIAEIKDPIEDPKQFSSIVQAMGDMEKDDVFELHITTDGGSISAGSCLLHAMDKCKGHIHVVATGGVHSFGTAILLKAHSFELSHEFEALIHAGSLGYGSDFSEYKQYSEFSIRQHDKFIRNTYKHFLDESEIVSLLNGKPIVLDADEWVSRSEQMNILITKEMEGSAKKPRKKPVSKKTVTDFKE